MLAKLLFFDKFVAISCKILRRTFFVRICFRLFRNTGLKSILCSDIKLLLFSSSHKCALINDLLYFSDAILLFSVVYLRRVVLSSTSRNPTGAPQDPTIRGIEICPTHTCSALNAAYCHRPKFLQQPMSNCFKVYIPFQMVRMLIQRILWVIHRIFLLFKISLFYPD